MIEPFPAIVFPPSFVIHVAFVKQLLNRTIQIMCHLVMIALARYLNEINGYQCNVRNVMYAVNAKKSIKLRMMLGFKCYFETVNL